jgi:tetratricopeptide (TPR) repeat protein
MTARKHALGLGLLLTVATSVPALAQTTSSSAGDPYPTCARKVDASESEAAHAKYLSGKVDYDEGKHDAAIQQFRQAYAKDCTKHELLVIISRAYEFKSDFAEAIRALETYLERVPGSPDAATHRSRIETLKGKLADQKAAPQSTAPAPAPTSTSPEGGIVDPPPGADEEQGHTALPWVVVGLGAAGIAAGIVVVALTPDLPGQCDAASQTCTRLTGESDKDFEDRQARAGASQTQPTVGYVIAGAGAALLLGGLVWHFAEPTGPKESAKTRLQPHVGPGYGGLALTGRF